MRVLVRFEKLLKLLTGLLTETIMIKGAGCGCHYRNQPGRMRFRQAHGVDENGFPDSIENEGCC